MKIPVHNQGAMPIYVGTAMVLPGETRHFDEQDVPSHLRPQPAEAEPAPDESQYDPLAELLAGSIKDITAAFGDLSDEDLVHIEELEAAAESPRKGLMAAIAEEKLKRAAAKDEQGDKPADDEAGAGANAGDGDAGGEG